MSQPRTGFQSVGTAQAVVTRRLDHEQQAITGSGKFVEVQGTAEGAPFDRDELNQLLDLALLGTTQLAAIQRETLADAL